MASNDLLPIPYGRQSVTEADVKAVTEVLQSDYLTQGPLISEFEHAFADYVGAKYAVAVANGTAALHLSALALRVSEGDKVLTTPITFVASANCVRYCGGELQFVDIDPETYLIDLAEVRRILESDDKGTYSGIIPVDFSGRPVNLEALKELADEYGLWILEDACHAPGGYFRDGEGKKRFCGNGKFSDLAIFSFHPVKHIAAGEGGMVTTNDESLYKKLLKLRTHGITKNETEFLNTKDLAAGIQNSEFKIQNYPNWYMEMQELGYNYRITDLQCALGISQLKRAEKSLQKRREKAEIYFRAFKGKDFIRGQSGVVDGHAYHLYVVEVEDRLGLYNYLRQHRIYSQVHYIPCHLMPYYRKRGWREGDLPNAETYYRRCLSLPMYPTLTQEQQEYVIEKVTGYYA